MIQKLLHAASIFPAINKTITADTNKGFLFLILLISQFFLNSCQITEKSDERKSFSVEILHETVSANYGPDGRLWRLLPTEQAVYVDYSNNDGITYSEPIKVNIQNQKISAWPENPPSIEISKSGRINVLYYADEQQKSTSFFSYSDDNGETFSTPVLVSDRAQSAMHYMDKMLIDKDDKLYLFWHDTRHETHDKEQGAGVLSLYYSVKKPTENAPFSNQFLSGGICSCCRTATTFSSNGKPVVLARMVYDNGVRDHALISMNAEGLWQKPQRVTYDNWEVEACPEHGPAIAVDENNRTHLSWFTLGKERSGIFYAQTDDNGKSVSTPIALGNQNNLPSHPDVIALKQRVIITWKEFDGEQTTLHIKQSSDRGKSWTNKSSGLNSKSKNSHPKLLTNDTDIFLSWSSKDEGHRITKL
jgi:hypothetical protein